jgi:hypothetical protein
MYVGKKAGSGDALNRNGLRGGRLYVLVSRDAVRKDEATFTAKGTSIVVGWREVDHTLNDAALDAQSKALGSFNFVRVEDGAANPRKKGQFWFDTTGGPGTSDPFGRLYRLDWDSKDPTDDGRLTLVLDGSEGIVSPDNLDMNRHGEIAICEDPNYNLANPPLSLTRDSSIWIYDTKKGSLTRVAEIDRAPAQAHALSVDAANVQTGANTPGQWETSGIIDAEAFLGRGGWLFNVQAHGLRIAPTAETVEGGQLLWMVHRCRDCDCDDDDHEGRRDDDDDDCDD